MELNRRNLFRAAGALVVGAVINGSSVLHGEVLPPLVEGSTDHFLELAKLGNPIIGKTFTLDRPIVLDSSVAKTFTNLLVQGCNFFCDFDGEAMVIVDKGFGLSGSTLVLKNNHFSNANRTEYFFKILN